MVDLNQYISELNREKEEQQAQKEAKRLGLSYFNLTDYKISPSVVGLVPEEDINQSKIIPYLKVGDDLKIGVVSPEDEKVTAKLAEISKETGLNIISVIISESSFIASLDEYEIAKKEALEEQKIQSQEALRNTELVVNNLEEVAKLVKRTSISDLLDIVVRAANSLGASDIHMEPRESDFIIRYRIDGVLMDVVILPIHTHTQILSRIKFLCKMKADLIGMPQDGSFSVRIGEDKNVDLRVSIMPATYGEAIAIRMMGQEGSLLTLDHFGFRADALAAIKDAASKPHGMILTSGPTGAGKSSTMYAIITYLRKPNIKIITLENPVEYKISGIEQSPVHPGDGYDFAEGLRASLRQDPDVLMVGEIRDAQTAEISIQAALTGHLLLSTIHANSAPAVFVRLLDIGVQPYLLAGSINLIMAQRLVRKICLDCREEYAPTALEWERIRTELLPIEDKFGPDIVEKLNSSTPKLYRGKGCEKCHNTGYKGRQIIVEYLKPEAQMEALIGQKSSVAEFDQLARDLGMITMRQDGLSKVVEGTSTLEEIERVTRE